MSNKNNIKVLMRVATLSATAHQNQDRKSGGNYIRHPLAVAALIEQEWLTLQNASVAICHDILEDVPEMLEQAAKEMALTFGGAFEEVLTNWSVDPNQQLKLLLAACKSPRNLERGLPFGEAVTDGVLELTVDWPRAGHPEDDPKDKVSKKKYEVERIQNLSLDAAAVTKADKTFNSRHPIPGRDPIKEAEKYQRYFDAVDERMGA